MKTKRILFVCLGNICRSPAAEAIVKKVASNSNINIFVDSAGTSAWHEGERADLRMRHHAKERGYDITSISRKFKTSDFDDFDMIIAMDNSNYFDLKSKARTPDDVKKIHRMSDFFSKSDFDHIPDPYYGGDAGFKLVIDLLEEGANGLIKYLQSSHS